MKKVTHTLLAVSCVFGVILSNGGASAITYQDESTVKFTFGSTLSVSLSDADIVIGNLIPGQDDLSNVVDIVVNTNNLYGYTLTATVGDSTKNYRDLRHTNGTANIASINVNSNLSTLTGESSSVWGYTVSTNGTTWSNYNGLPKYDDTTNTAELNVTNGAAADSTTSFKIGAYAEEGQLAGDYTNVINFKVVSNAPAQSTPTMQTLTASECTTTPLVVTDGRDGEEYTVQRLADGNCWMLDNLRLGGDSTIALTPADTNIPSDFTLPASGNIGSETYFNEPRINADYKDMLADYGDGTNKSGVYYNFCAASGGTMCTDRYSIDSTMLENGSFKYDICPAGWRMPTGGSDREYAALYTAYNSNDIDMKNALHAGLSGRYFDGQRSTGYGIIWASTFYDTETTYVFAIYSDSVAPQWNTSNRAYGNSVRCLLQES